MGAAAWIKEKAAASLHSAQVETTLIQLNAAWPPDGAPLSNTLENFPLGAESLLRLLALSSICAGRIAQNPDLLIWLAQPEICSQPRDQVDMASELHRIAQDNVAFGNFRALRRWKIIPLIVLDPPSTFPRAWSARWPFISGSGSDSYIQS